MKIVGGEEISPFDRLVWPEGAIEALLASGERRRELVAYLGEEEYEALRPLAIAAARARRDPDRCVYLVPGIMGSQLGLPRPAPLPANLLWIDPIDFQLGHLALLALPGPPIRALGPVLYSYLPLKLALEATGCTVRYFDYDWRLELDTPAAALAERLAAEPGRQIRIIGHSMGGLVARLALQLPGGARVRQLITLGTPHGGSFAPLQALRGVYPLVRRVAQLDPLHSAEQLAANVFSTFPSLYQMLPPPDGGLDLTDARGWPAAGPQPHASLLAQSRLNPPPVDGRIVCIAGYGYDTVVEAARHGEEFIYRIDRHGDGTVPTARSVLPDAGKGYCAVGHSDLPRSPLVHAALIRLLAGEPSGLAESAPPSLPGEARRFADSDLRALFNDKIDWAALDPAARRYFLDSLNESTLPESPAPKPRP